MSFGLKTFKNSKFEFPDYETIEGETRYYKTPSGNYPSMTSVLKILDDGGIEKWRQRVGEDEANRIVKEATTRGDALHALVEDYLTNQITRKQISDSGVAPMFNRIRRHYDDFTIIHGVEVALYSEHYQKAGRTDVLASVGKTLYICDTKNSRKPIDTKTKFGRKKLFKYKVQCAGYAMMLNEMFGLCPSRGRICVANFETMDSDVFDFPIDSELLKEFDYLCRCYDKGIEPKESGYFKI